MQEYLTKKANLIKDIEVNILYHEKLANICNKNVKKVGLTNTLLSAAALGLAFDCLQLLEKFDFWSSEKTDYIQYVAAGLVALFLFIVNSVSSNKNWQDGILDNANMKNSFINILSKLNDLSDRYINTRKEQLINQKLSVIEASYQGVSQRQPVNKDDDLLYLCSYEVRERRNLPIPDHIKERVKNFSWLYRRRHNIKIKVD